MPGYRDASQCEMEILMKKSKYQISNTQLPISKCSLLQATGCLMHSDIRDGVFLCAGITEPRDINRLDLLRDGH
jgi:hypothetical protein